MSNYLGFEPCNDSDYYFVSYNNEDAERVGAITQKLCNNLPLWYDYGIEYGKKWKKIITEKIAASRAVILFFTKGILLKEESYVQTEYEIATEFFDKKVYVVMLDHVEKKSVPKDKVFWFIDICERQNINAFDTSNPDIISNTITSALGIKKHENAKTLQDNNPKPNKEFAVTDSWEQYTRGYAYEFGKGVKQDYAEAVKWYKLSAAQGNAWSQNRLGDCYYNGNGVTKDYEKAFKWYSLSAEQEDMVATCNLGRCYLYGNGTEQNHEIAVQHFMYAAYNKNASGHAWLGFCYYNGYGVDKNIIIAKDQYEQAAAQGIKWAENELKKINSAEASKSKQDEKVFTYSEFKDLEHKTFGDITEKFVIPCRYTKISEGALRDIHTKSIYIPSTIRSIDQNSFINMSVWINNIYISADNPYFYVNTSSLVEKETGLEIPLGRINGNLFLYHEH